MNSQNQVESEEIVAVLETSNNDIAISNDIAIPFIANFFAQVPDNFEQALKVSTGTKNKDTDKDW